jgi:rod shape determining protein RodA
MFFHVALNICMTIGLAPSPGITLPLLSYGGSSLLTFTILIFILIRLDADRQMVLR